MTDLPANLESGQVEQPKTSAPPPLRTVGGRCPAVSVGKMPDQRPDWAFWKHMGEVPLSTAVALALNLNPEYLDYRRKTVADPNKALPVEYIQLWRIANSRISEIDIGSSGFEVELSKFGQFMMKMEDSFPLPPDFPRARRGHGWLDELAEVMHNKKTEAIDEIPDEVHGIPVPPYATEKLTTVIAIMRECKDLNTNLVALVEQRTGLKNRDAKIIAALINPNPDERAKHWKPRTSDQGKKSSV